MYWRIDEGKYLSSGRWLIVISPLPSVRITRAMAALRRPTALTVSIVQRKVLGDLFHCVDVKHHGILGFVGMVGPVVHVQVLDELAPKTVFGEHALHHADVEGVHACLEVLVVRFLHQDGGCELTLAAGITCEVQVDAVIPFVAGENHLLGIDDDDIVSALHEGGVAGLVLSTQNFRNLRAKTAEHLVGCVNHNPLFLDAFGVRGKGLVT